MQYKSIFKTATRRSDDKKAICTIKTNLLIKTDDKKNK